MKLISKVNLKYLCTNIHIKLKVFCQYYFKENIGINNTIICHNYNEY